jgi:hypothetical protein
MSLLSTASTWTNDDKPNKKRVSTMRQTLQTKEAQKPSVSSYIQKADEYQEYKVTEESSDYVMHSISDVQKDRETREARVNQILNQMTAAQGENDGGYLADFNPPDKPVVHIKKDLQKVWKKADEPVAPLENEMYPVTNTVSNPSPSNRTYDTYYMNGGHGQGNGSNYNSVYDPNVKLKPYYSKMGLGTSNSGSIGNQDKLLERINYMIHLLENQEYEKTANITEEFILYSFLGIFVIFVLDSFSRTAKYTR